jgi:hypothetical protein
VLAIAVALAATVLRSDETIPAQPGPRLLANTSLVSQGGSMASAFGSVWVADIARDRVLRLDPRTRELEARIPVGGQAWVGAAAGSMWAVGRDRVLRIDPSTNRIVATLPSLGSAPGVILEGRGVVWMGNPQTLARVDLARNAITRTVPISRDGFKAVDGGSDGRILYIVRGDRRLLRFDARSGKLLSSVPANGVGLLGVAGGTVFLVGESGMSAIDGATGRTRWTRDLHAQQVNNGTLDGTTLWVHTSERRDHLWRLDARSGRVTGSLALPEFGATGVVAVGEQVWTMSTGGDLQVALGKG